MAKKKEVTLKLDGGTRDAVPSGEVNIYYGQRTLIGGLSETVIAKLETEDTIVRKNIFVEYNRPTNLYYKKVIRVTNSITVAQGTVILGWAYKDSDGDMNISGIAADSSLTFLTFYYDRSGQTLSLLIMPLLTSGLTPVLTADGSPVTLIPFVPDKLYLAKLPFNTSAVTISAE